MTHTNQDWNDPRSVIPSVQHLKMQVQVVGEGPPLVFVGGGLTGWHSWKPHAERLAGTRTVARLQPLNVEYGLEDRPLPEGYSVKTESAALAAALDGLGWEDPMDVVAWSYGALVTLDFALDHPERIRTLTLIEPPAIWVLPEDDPGDPELQVLESFGTNDDISEADLDRFLRVAGLLPSGANAKELPQWPVWVEHRRSLRMGAAPSRHRDDPERLRTFDRPVLLVSGTGTAFYYRRILDNLGEYLPRTRAVEMPSGHAPHIVSMDRFLAELERFLSAPSRSQPVDGDGSDSPVVR